MKITPGTGTLAIQGQNVKLLVHQRGSLIQTTDYLATTWRASSDQMARSYLAIAATLVAHVAVEAILNEWAHDTDAALYKKHHNAGLVNRATELCGQIRVSVPKDVAELSSAKNALGHAEPDNSRSAVVGNWVGGDGAERALAVVVACEGLFFPRGELRARP
jgi:hypothetical protein